MASLARQPIEVKAAQLKSEEITKEQIAQRAYELWERGGSYRGKIKITGFKPWLN